MGKFILNTVLGLLPFFILIESVSIKNGVIDIGDHKECTIQNDNGTIIINKDNKNKFLFYGYLEYNCTNDFGTMISIPECLKCGLYCTSNEIIPGCKQDTFKVYIGLIITTFIIMLLSILFKSKISVIINKFIRKVIETKKNISKERKEKKVLKMTKLLERIKDIEAPDNVDEQGTEAIIETGQNADNKKTTPYSMLQRSLERIDEAMSVQNLIRGTVMLSGIQQISSCDKTMFLSHNGKICDNSKCHDMNMYSISILYGSTICFKDIEDNMFKISVSESYIRHKYNAIYDTSEIKIRINEEYSRCKGAGTCWNGACKMGYKHNGFKYSGDMIFGYDCDVSALGCDTWCHHKLSCTWLEWVIDEVGERARIFEHTTKIWEIVVKIEYKGIVKYVTFNTNNIENALIGMNLESINTIPIIITGTQYEREDYPEMIAGMNGAYREVDANKQNSLAPGKVGDYQIALDNKSRGYLTSLVICKAESCTAKCRIPESRLKYALMDKDNITVYNANNNTIETKQHNYASVTMMLGNVEFSNLHITPANCQIDVITTFGCKGCNKMPYVVFKAHTIKAEGMMEYTSNCNFDRKYMSCSSSYYVLHHQSMKENCTIFIPRTNQTINFNTEFKFTGSIHLSRPLYSDDTIGDIMKDILSTDVFWTSLISSFLTFSGLTIVVTTIIRSIKMLLMYRSCVKVEQSALQK